MKIPLGLGRDLFGLFKFPDEIGTQPTVPAILTRERLRRWQGEAHDKLIEARVAGFVHAYLQAPTGSGKTLFMGYHGENSDVPGTRVLMVARRKLVRQHRKSLIEKGWRGDVNQPILWSPSGQKWVVETWSSLRNDCARIEAGFRSRYFEHGEEVGILFFDESHIGGCTEDDPDQNHQSSFTRINETLRPRFRLYVSATGYLVNEDMLGKSEADNTYIYTMRAAYADRILHPVSLIGIHSGLTVKIAKVEKILQKSFEELQYDPDLEITADDDETLSDVAGKMADYEVVIPKESEVSADMRAYARRLQREIICARQETMVNLYFNSHPGEQAVFYCPNISRAQDALTYFNGQARAHAQKTGQHPLTATIAHSEVGGKLADEAIESFERGLVHVIFVVGMLQEGWDMPRLQLAFDCRFYSVWRKPQIARLTQKIGRLMRLYADEDGNLLCGTKRYYYARDITHFYNTRVNTNPEAPSLVEREEGYLGIDPDEMPKTEQGKNALREYEENQALMAAACDVATSLNDGDAVNPNAAVKMGTVDTTPQQSTGFNPEDFSTKQKTLELNLAELFLTGVSGGRAVESRSVRQLLGADDLTVIQNDPESETILQELATFRG